MSTSSQAIRRVLLGAFALAALAVPASAPAASPVTVRVPASADGATLRAQLQADVAVAERRFGPACSGGITATWDPFEVDYPNSPGARAWARSFAEECRIYFNLGLWLDPT